LFFFASATTTDRLNRVFVRSTMEAGDITVTATRTGLASGVATVTSKAVNVVNGLL
jgi:hypothetical protein